MASCPRVLRSVGILKKSQNQHLFRGIKKTKKLVYAYDNIENKIPLWVSRGYVVCVATAKQSVQVHVREEKVNPGKK